MDLTDYIAKYYNGSKEALAEAWGLGNVTKVDTWIRAGYIFEDHRPYSPRCQGRQVIPPSLK